MNKTINNDILKFRVWSEIEKRYVLTENLVINNDGEIVEPHYTLNGDIHFYRPTENLIVEQCSGLKDRNGKLIFVGDILLSSDGSNYSVEYDLHYARFLRRGKFNNGTSFFAELDSTKAKGYMRVIGNIHENPELLEETK